MPQDMNQGIDQALDPNLGQGHGHAIAPGMTTAMAPSMEPQAMAAQAMATQAMVQQSMEPQALA